MNEFLSTAGSSISCAPQVPSLTHKQGGFISRQTSRSLEGFALARAVYYSELKT